MDILKRFSWLLAALGTLVLLIAAVWGYMVGPEGTAFIALVVSGAVLVVGWIALDRDALIGAAQSRNNQLSVGSVLLTILAAALTLVAQVGVSRYDHTFDLTRDQHLTLSDASKGLLASMTEPVVMYAFFRPGTESGESVADLTGRMQENTSQLTVTFVDPVADPLLARKYSITSENGTIVLEKGDRTQRLEDSFEEKDIIDALTRLNSGKDHRICWSVGHGERSQDDDSSAEGFGSIVVKLEGKNYTVTKSDIMAQGIDPECEAIVVAAPMRDFLPHEREALAAYIAGGGRAMLLIEPEVYEDMGSPGLAADMDRYGLTLKEDIVLEGDPMYRLQGREDDPSTFIITPDAFGMHDITNRLQSFALFQTARSIVPKDDHVQKVLMHGSESTWGETSLDTLPPIPDSTVDTVGDVPLAVAIEITDPDSIHVAAHVDPKPAAPVAPPTNPDGTPALNPDGTPITAPLFDPSATTAPERGVGVPAGFMPKEGGRMVVIGDADFASNAGVSFGNNQDLFLNSIAWLVHEDSQLGERAEDEPERFEPGLIGLAVVFISTMLLIPGAAITMAIGMAVRRRML